MLGGLTHLPQGSECVSNGSRYCNDFVIYFISLGHCRCVNYKQTTLCEILLFVITLNYLCLIFS